jgi:ArsR family transcriptional regulator
MTFASLKKNPRRDSTKNVRVVPPDGAHAAYPLGLIQIYQCLCDPTRIRILNLLGEGELCVCHFQEILGEPQVKVSKHLAYLRKRGLVVARKEANWVIYAVATRPSGELSANLACLQDCVRENAAFRRDLEKRRKLACSMAENSPVCCPPKSIKKSRASIT